MAIPRLYKRPFMAFVFTLFAGCDGGGSGGSGTAPLSADNLNLIFVVSPDIAFQTPGDINSDTANLSDQGLQRSLLIATYLKQQVLGTNNVSSIHALQPMTHLQTAGDYPDMAAIGFIQQFALLNQFTLPVDANGAVYTANTYPFDVAYAAGSVPKGVALPSSYCPDCVGLDFNDANGNNEAMVSGLIKQNARGYHVFSAPWETVSALLASVNKRQGYGLNVPTAYLGTNHLYAISITPSGNASLVAFDSKLNPPATYPMLPTPVTSAACTHTQQAYFSTVRTGGVNGAMIPANSNTNQRTFIVRHAEAHPDPGSNFEDGNYVGAGQWRALALPEALRAKLSPSPNMAYSIDPAQWFTGANVSVSYVRPSLTILPYVIANNLPYKLVSSFGLSNPNEPQLASDLFFTGGELSNKTVLVAWESTRIKPLINALLNTYGVSSLPLLPVAWPVTDYDTIWTVTLDAGGNLTVDDALCEGIESKALPATAPQF